MLTWACKNVRLFIGLSVVPISRKSAGVLLQKRTLTRQLAAA